MYICRSCGLRFYESYMKPVVLVESEGFRQYGYADACPECGSRNYVETRRCRVCGEYMDPDQLHGGTCDDCMEDYYTKTNVRAFIEENRDAWGDFVGDLHRKLVNE